MPTCRLPPDRVPAGAKDWRTGCPARPSAVRAQPARRFSRRSCAICPPVFPLFLPCSCPVPALSARNLPAACPPVFPPFVRSLPAIRRCQFAASAQLARRFPVVPALSVRLLPGFPGPPPFFRPLLAPGTRKRGCCEKRHPRTCRPCKPGSVPGTMPGPLSFIWDGSHLPPLATYPPASGEQPLIAGIHGLATRETYCRVTSLPPRWALTPPFHPYLPGFKQIPCGRSFSVTLLYPHEYQVVSLRGALCCPDFPPPAEAGSDKAGLRRKGSKIPRIPAPAF